MRLGIVGGRLRGIEAVYLAKVAAHESVLIDRHRAPPAFGLASESHALDLPADPVRARAVLTSRDAVLPACENLETLRSLDVSLRA